MRNGSASSEHVVEGCPVTGFSIPPKPRLAEAAFRSSICMASQARASTHYLPSLYGAVGGDKHFDSLMMAMRRTGPRPRPVHAPSRSVPNRLRQVLGSVSRVVEQRWNGVLSCILPPLPDARDIGECDKRHATVNPAESQNTPQEIDKTAFTRGDGLIGQVAFSDSA